MSYCYRHTSHESCLHSSQFIEGFDSYNVSISNCMLFETFFGNLCLLLWTICQPMILENQLSDACCPVCLELLAADCGIISSLCNHRFHLSCLAKWSGMDSSICNHRFHLSCLAKWSGMDSSLCNHRFHLSCLAKWSGMDSSLCNHRFYLSCLAKWSGMDSSLCNHRFYLSCLAKWSGMDYTEYVC